MRMTKKTWNTQSIRRLSSALLAAAMLIAANTPAQAQSIKFGLRPDDPLKGYFQFTLNSGESVSDAVLAVNNSESESVALDVRPTLAYTALTGGIAFDNAPATGVALWMAMPDAGRVEVPAGKSARLPFTIAVPAGTPAGEYVFGIIAALADAPQSVDAGAGMSVQVVQQAAVTVVVTVPGNVVEAMAIDSVQAEQDRSGQLLTKVAIRNGGGAGWKGTGELVIRKDDREIVHQSFNVGYVIAGTQFAYPVYALSPDNGTYKVDAFLLGEGGAQAAEYHGAVTVGAPLELPPVLSQPASETGQGETGTVLSPLVGRFALIVVAVGLLVGVVLMWKR